MALFPPEAKMPAFANGFYFAEIVSITKPIGLSPTEIVFNNRGSADESRAIATSSPCQGPLYTLLLLYTSDQLESRCQLSIPRRQLAANITILESPSGHFMGRQKPCCVHCSSVSVLTTFGELVVS